MGRVESQASPEDIQYVEQHSSNMTITEVAERLGVDYDLARRWLAKRGLPKKSAQNLWTDEEVDFLLRYYPTVGAAYVAKALGRPLCGVYAKRRLVMRNSRLPEGFCVRISKKWPLAELGYVVAQLESVGEPYIVASVGRNGKCAVYTKANPKLPTFWHGVEPPREDWVHRSLN